MRRLLPALLAALLPLTLWTAPAAACTNLIVSRGASTDGSVMLTYTCDGEFHPILRSWPAADHGPDEWFELKSWGGEVLGKVKQPAHTYGVVNLMNDHQVSIGETTTGGREELVNPDGILSYWRLMQITLQRAATAREAVTVMGDLVAEYGYRSSGESFVIADPAEAWIMEMVGPGPGGAGAHWVALRVPDGYISAFANGGRIGTFPLDKPEDCLHSGGIAEFAAARGWYDPAVDGDFNWREAFHPMDAQKLRYTATRVWSLFRRAAPGLDLPDDYHRGVPGAEPYPLWIKPDHKLDVAAVFDLMRDHYEGTPYDMTVGVDAGPYASPERWRPMGWEVDGTSYTWERPISTQQTGFSMVTQSRDWLPDPVGGLTWYGLDNTWFTCYTPLYSGITDLPPSFTRGGLGEFSWDSAWWVFNFVSNLASVKHSYMSADIEAVRQAIEADYLALQPAVEATAARLFETDPDLMAAYLTDYSVMHAEDLVRKWRRLGEFLLTRYNDGYVKDDEGRVTEQGYPDAWLREVLRARPDRFRLPEGTGAAGEPKDY